MCSKNSFDSFKTHHFLSTCMHFQGSPGKGKKHNFGVFFFSYSVGRLATVSMDSCEEWKTSTILGLIFMFGIVLELDWFILRKVVGVSPVWARLGTPGENVCVSCAWLSFDGPCFIFNENECRLLVMIKIGW